MSDTERALAGAYFDLRGIELGRKSKAYVAAMASAGVLVHHICLVATAIAASARRYFLLHPVWNGVSKALPPFCLANAA
jgi:hypothetical protein